jgi:ribosomal protein S4E
LTGAFADYATRLDTTNGTIYVDGDVTDDGHYNTGMSDQIDISTTNGSIHLNFLG